MTEAGKRLLTLYSRPPSPIRDLADGIEAAGRAALIVDIAAIEAEARADEAAHTAEAVAKAATGFVIIVKEQAERCRKPFFYFAGDSRLVEEWNKGVDSLEREILKALK